MKNYRLNSICAGGLYVLGTVFGILALVVGGDALSSIITDVSLEGVDLLALAAESSSRLSGGAFLTLMMGISLSAMTIFLYPVFRKDSEELAAGMLLFRGAIEGVYYLITTLGILTMALLGTEYAASGSSSAPLQSMGNVVYEFLNSAGHAGTFMFLTGAVFLYISFYRTRLIPRWLSIWGLIGAVPYMVNAALHILQADVGGIGLYLEMPLAFQEIVMGLWLLIAGFNKEAVRKLNEG